MYSTRNQNGVFDIAELNNLGANKNSNPSQAPGNDTIRVKARGVPYSPSRQQGGKLGDNLHRKTMGFLQAQNMPFLCQFSQKIKGKGTLSRITNKKSSTVPSTNLKGATQWAQGEG